MVQGIWLTSGSALPDSVALGGGFRQDGPLDRLSPGPELALVLPGGVDAPGLGDGDLTGVVRGWRRLSSWAAAMELSAVAELAGRRIGEAEAAGACASDAERFAAAEVAAALTLTRCSAEALVERALSLSDLPGTSAALAAGVIDVPKALVILAGMAGLGAEQCPGVEALVLGKAEAQTTGELRKAVARAVMAADPAAAEERRAAAEKGARVERWAEPAGTGAIAGRDLPAAEVLAAGNRINALAAALKADGAPGPMDLLRARVFTGLLLGHPVAAPAAGTPPIDSAAAVENAPPADRAAPGRDAAPTNGAAPLGGIPPADRAAAVENAPPADRAAPGANAAPIAGAAPLGGTPPAGGAGPVADAGPVDGAPRPAGSPGGGGAPGSGTVLAGPPGPRDLAGLAGLAGSVQLTVPLAALAGPNGPAAGPGEVAGFGPVTAATTEELLAGARGSPGTRWCVTVTGADGQALGHGCATPTPTAAAAAGRDGGWALTVQVRALAAGDCGHEGKTAAYRPPRALRHLVQVRHPRCVFPGCGRPARQCDLDHTVAYRDGGATCACNLAPLCRFHHKVKHASGWQLAHPAPGILRWTTPSGWTYQVPPHPHPT